MNKSPPLQEILKLLREIRAEIWILNADERLRGLNSRIDTIQGNAEHREKKLAAMEKYWGLTFNQQ